MNMVTQKARSIQLAKGKEGENKHIIKDQLLMAPGVWNDVEFSKEEIKKAYENTDWSDKYNKSVIIDHADGEKNSDVSMRDWVGWIVSPRLKDGKLYGDVEIYDGDMIAKVIKAKAKCGISPRVRGKVDEQGAMKDIKFENFSIVSNPAVKEAYINLSEKVKENKEIDDMIKLLKEIKELARGEGRGQGGERQGDGGADMCVCPECGYKEKHKKGAPCTEKKCPKCGATMEGVSENEELAGFEEIRKRQNKSPAEFYAAPRDPPSESKLPIYDEKHVRNAMARFNQTDFKSQEEKKKAKGKIIREAKKHDINVDKFREVGPELSNKDYKKDKKEVKMSEEEQKETKVSEEEEKEEEQEEEVEQEESEEEVSQEEEDEEPEEKQENEEVDEEELKELMQEDNFRKYVEKHKSLSLSEIAKKYKKEKYDLEKKEMKEKLEQLQKKVEKLSKDSPDSRSVQELSDKKEKSRSDVFGKKEATKGEKEMIKLLKDKKIL